MIGWRKLNASYARLECMAHFGGGYVQQPNKMKNIKNNTKLLIYSKYTSFCCIQKHQVIMMFKRHFKFCRHASVTSRYVLQ